MIFFLQRHNYNSNSFLFHNYLISDFIFISFLMIFKNFLTYRVEGLVHLLLGFFFFLVMKVFK